MTAVLVADSLVTRLVPPDGAKPVLPSTVLSTGIGPSTVYLKRKVNIVGPSAVAMSGMGDDIATALKEFALFQETYDEGNPTPMRWLGDAANTLNAQNLRPGRQPLSVVGARWHGASVNVMTRNPPLATKLLGQCSAVGSGAAELEAACVDYDLWGDRRLQPYLRAAIFVAGINARKLGREIGDRAPHNHWGGYVEMAAANNAEQGWVRGLPALHVFLKAKFRDDETFSLEVVRRFIAYSPGQEQGRVLSGQWQDQRVQSVDFILEDILAPVGSTAAARRDFWDGYEPFIATITILNLSNPQGQLRFAHLIKPTPEQLEFKLTWNSARDGYDLDFGISAQGLDAFGNALTLRGYAYRPD